MEESASLLYQYIILRHNKLFKKEYSIITPYTTNPKQLHVVN